MLICARVRKSFRVINLITLQWGKQIVVAVQAEMVDYDSGRAMVDAINVIEEICSARFPKRVGCFSNRNSARGEARA